jgi:uncharacterized protein (TIGR02271 family)
MTKKSGMTAAGKVIHHLQSEAHVSHAQQVIPVLHEQLEIHKVAEETGAIRVRTIVHDELCTVDMTLAREGVSVTRVPLNKVVDAKFPSRQQGDTLVIPIYKEILAKQLVLVEEVHVTTRRSAENTTQSVTLKREEAIVERYDEESGSWKPDAPH